MILLIGPCMFLAPLVVVLIPVAIVLWLPVLALLGVAWLLILPVAAATGKDSRIGAAHTTLGHWFRTLLTPWTYFDVPEKPPTKPNADA